MRPCFPQVHVVNPEGGSKLPEWFRKNNWDGVLPMAKYDFFSADSDTDFADIFSRIFISFP